MARHSPQEVKETVFDGDDYFNIQESIKVTDNLPLNKVWEGTGGNNYNDDSKDKNNGKGNEKDKK